MPIIKAQIEGREYAFAPLKLKQIREIRTSDQAQGLKDGVAAVDFWMPYIEDSAARAGTDTAELPDLEEMEIEKASRVFGDMLLAVLKASGLELKSPGEIPLAAENPPTGTTSTVSS